MTCIQMQVLMIRLRQFNAEFRPVLYHTKLCIFSPEAHMNTPSHICTLQYQNWTKWTLYNIFEVTLKLILSSPILNTYLQQQQQITMAHCLSWLFGYEYDSSVRSLNNNVVFEPHEIDTPLLIYPEINF